ncbi:MAG: hypothetical protein LLF93_06075 [Bacteroidales bacterium]|nr:hypothetical protein [Bacteroidales bacterium]
MTCLILPVYAQKENRGIEYKYNIEAVLNSPGVVWYGNDVSHSRMLDFKKFEEGEVILKANMPGILAELEYKYNEEFMKRNSKKEKVIFDMVSIQDLYKTILEPKEFIISRPYEMTIDDVKSIVANYKLPQKEGLGLVVIVEMFHKPERYVTGYVTFFDIASREVYYATKMKGVAGSKSGFNLYWSNGIKRIMGYFFDGYFRKLGN